MKKLLFITVSLFFISLIATAQDSLINYEDINGKKQGYWLKKDKSGNKVYEGYFKNNVPVGKFQKFHPNGNLKYDMFYNPKDANDVSVTMYDEMGELSAKGFYYSKKKDSTWQYFGNQEILVMEENYNHGKLDGKSIIYWQSEYHLPAEIKHWKNNIKHGDWKWFYDGGNLRMQANYNENKLDGDFIVYFVDGSIHVSGAYVNDVRNGIWKYFNDNGTERATIEYNMGKVVNEDEFERQQTKAINEQYLDSIPNYVEPKFFGEAEQEAIVPEPDDPETFMDNPEEYIMKDMGLDAGNQQQEAPEKKKKKKKK